MKQLLSRNPVERFKQIIKAQQGTSLVSYKATPLQKGWKDTGQFDATINNLTDQQKSWLDAQGISYQNANSLQAGMNNYLVQQGNTKHGLKQDGKWGTQSGNALNAILANMPSDWKTDMQKTNEGTQQPTTPQPTRPVVPDFGYRSTFNYADGTRNFGFNNYRGMVAFANTYKDDPFAQDLRKRFGDDPTQWNQATVERALNVRGKYRRGSGGDMGDMMRSMAGWAGGMNRQYDDRYKAYRAAQQTPKPAAPMDDAAQFYEWAKNQPEIMQRYNSFKNPNQHSEGYIPPAAR